MMCKRQGNRENLVVLRVDRAVLALPRVIVSDGNASSDYTAFYASPEACAI